MPTAVDQYNYIMHNIMFEGTLLIVPPEPNMHIAILPCIYDMVCCNCALQAIEVYSIQLHKLKTLFINPHLVDLHTYVHTRHFRNATYELHRVQACIANHTE